jgi:cytochrome c oxidase subunit II
MQSMLAPAGADAQQIATLWWVLFGICTVVTVIVFAFVARALLVRREVTDAGEATKRKFVASGALVSLVILIGILVASVTTGRATTTGVQDPLTIEVIGHQWWWEVRYLDPSPHRHVTTANEIHLPVGERVRLRAPLERRDPQPLDPEPRRQGRPCSRTARTRSGWSRRSRAHIAASARSSAACSTA